MRRNKERTKLWLSANETDAWANRAGSSWPCSTLAGHRLFVELDPRNGDLVDLAVDGWTDFDVPAHELNAIVEDHINQ